MTTKFYTNPEVLQYQLLKQLFKLQYPFKMKRYQKRILSPKFYEKACQRQKCQ